MPRLIIATILSLSATLACHATPAPSQHGYKVTASMAQSRENFVQGLQIVDQQLYVGTGHHGQSRLLRYNMDDGALDQSRSVDARLFGEGVTVLDDKVYQLTWRSGLALIYNKADLSPHKWFRVPGEGWGITNNGKELIYSDGSSHLYFVSPETLTITHSLQVTENGEPVVKLNELEWIGGEIWANIWTTDRIVIINPTDGTVSASVDLTGLLPHNERRPDTDVLNGIAQNPADGSIWVTGKRWPWLYQIELIPPRPQKPGRDHL